MRKKNILLIGPLGEVGGVSVHLKRLISLLEDEFEFYIINESKILIKGNNTLNLRKFDLINYFRFIKRSKRIHIHSGSILLRLFHLIIGAFFNKKKIVTLHSYRKSTRIHDSLIRNLSNSIISVSDEIDCKIKSKKSLVLNAFIPPKIDQEPKLDSDFLSLLNKKKNSGKFIISGNAFRIVFQNGKDLYGIDQLIDLSKLLKKNSFPGFIVFIIGSLINGEEKYIEYQNIIERQELSEYIQLIHKNLSFVKLIEKSDLVVRPTISDGDALTIREAIYLNTPVIASDVVKRPIETRLYKINNIDDFYRVVTDTLINKKNDNKHNNGIDKFKKTYKNIYNL